MGSLCRGGFIRSFSLLIGLSEAENLPFSHTKRFPFAESFTLCPQKPLVFATKTSLIRTTFYCPQKLPFLRTKTYLLHKPFLAGFKNRPFSQTKSLAFAQTFSYSHPKQSFSALRNPFQRPLTYCLQRMRLFFCSSL